MSPVKKLGTIADQYRYSEGIEILYAANQFEFNSIYNFHCFSVTIPHQRMDAIRNLYMSYMFEGIESKLYYNGNWEFLQPDSDWTRTCDILSGMKGLQVLGFYLYLSGDKVVDLEQETISLAPLTSIKSPKNFTVDVKWVVNREDAGPVDRPFCLSRAVKYC